MSEWLTVMISPFNVTWPDYLKVYKDDEGPRVYAQIKTCVYDFVPNIGNGHLNSCGLKCSECGREQMSLEAPIYCPDCGCKVMDSE